MRIVSWSKQSFRPFSYLSHAKPCRKLRYSLTIALLDIMWKAQPGGSAFGTTKNFVLFETEKFEIAGCSLQYPLYSTNWTIFFSPQLTRSRRVHFSNFRKGNDFLKVVKSYAKFQMITVKTEMCSRTSCSGPNILNYNSSVFIPVLYYLH